MLIRQELFESRALTVAFSAQEDLSQGGGNAVELSHGQGDAGMR
jgi:hypothetical protein